MIESLKYLSADDKAALDLLAARQDAMLAQTLTWAKINTGSWNARGLETLAPHILSALGALDADVISLKTDPIEGIGKNAETTQFQSGPILKATARPQAPFQIVMTGHYDTVFPPDTFQDITHLPNGQINGPGLADMKGGIVVMIEALKAFEASPLKNKIGYRLILSPDEETGNFASAQHIKEAARGAHLGMTYEPAMDDGSLAGARKGSAIFDITLRGRAAHAGRNPEDGRNAMVAAADLILKIEALNGAYDGATLNVGAVDGGGAVNIVPDLAIVRVGARAPDAAASKWVTDAVTRCLHDVEQRDGISGSIHGGFYRPPKPRNRAQECLFDAVVQTGEALDLSICFKDTGGVCEGCNVFAAGVPNVDTLGVRGGRIHSADEYLIPESLSERAGLSALLLNRIADGRIDAPGIHALMEK